MTDDSKSLTKHLSHRAFHHHFVGHLTADPETRNFTRNVEEAFYSFVHPSPTRKPELVAWSDRLAADFGLERPEPGSSDIQILSGNLTNPEMKPYAGLYGGHQFGHWAGQLGDGRAITLGEIENLKGELWDLQLKGAGPTPYSRNADGRAVLRSSIREFVCSEAMHALGVPTTRALSLVTTGDSVVRDMFYDGHPEREPGAIVTRMAPSFLRFGHFEIFSSRGDLINLRRLVTYCIDRFYPQFSNGGELALIPFFREVCHRSARTVADWMSLGFVHGVMNTDNMSILGLTIDYGPYGWVDDYDLSWTPNTTDLPGRRYCYGRQPIILMWNLVRLAESLASLTPDDVHSFEQVLVETENFLGHLLLQKKSQKLGLNPLSADKDIAFIEQLDKCLRAQETDMTLFYRGLSNWILDPQIPEAKAPAFLAEALYHPEDLTLEKLKAWQSWLHDFKLRAEREGRSAEERSRLMKLHNPIYVPRNYLTQECIEAAEAGDFKKLESYMKVLSQPYSEQPGAEHFAQKRPEWAKTKAGCSSLSCSS